jgi:hypothetical protein
LIGTGPYMDKASPSNWLINLAQLQLYACKRSIRQPDILVVTSRVFFSMLGKNKKITVKIDE